MTGLQASDSRYFVGSATGDLVQLAKGGGGGRRPFEIRPSGTGMYDTFGDKRVLFLKALEGYVSENVRAINVELQAPGSPLAAIRSALVHFSERKDLSSTDGCMGINAICEFGMRD